MLNLEYLDVPGDLGFASTSGLYCLTKPLKSVADDGDNPLSVFVALAAHKLKFLETEFGLLRSSNVARPPEAIVKYDSESVRIKAFYEHPSSVWLAVETWTNRNWKSVGLHQVLKRLGQNVPSDVLQSIDLESALSFYAAALRKNWSLIIDKARRP